MRSEFYVEKVMTYQQLIRTLQENSRPELSGFNDKIINSGVPKLGCTLPFVRKVAKGYVLSDIETLPIHTYYEVDLLRGIVIANSKLPFAEKSKYLVEFAETIENWAVCDSSVVKVPKSERELYFDFFSTLLPSEQPFVCRYGVVNLMGNFLDAEHVDKVFAQLGKISTWGQYYVDMGVAWLVASAMAKCRDATVKFMEGQGRRILNRSAYNKALQKMRDSFRVSEEDKRWTYTMKML